MLEDPSLVFLVLFVGVVAVAGLVHGTLGLGFPLVSTPLLALFMDVRAAILLTLLPTVAVNLVSIVRGGRWRVSIGAFWPLAGYALLGGVIGAQGLAQSEDTAVFSLLLALLVFLYLGADRIGAVRMGWVKDHRHASMFVFGLVAGLSAGATNVMVPILIIYTLELGLAKTQMVQTFNLCFLAGKLAQIGVFSSVALFDRQTAIATLPLVIAALAALFAGMWIRDRISTELYRRVVKQVLFVLALILMSQYFVAMW